MVEFEQYMRIAIIEAESSLREGKNGFGAVIVNAGELIAASHDMKDAEDDTSTHAEINAIVEASKKLGNNLSGCVLITTNEPCPMCASAIARSGIKTMVVGYSNGPNSICAELFQKAEADIKIYSGILKNECSILYRDDVRKEIGRLRHANDSILDKLNEDSIDRRTAWYHENEHRFEFISGDLLDSGYRLLLERFCITPDEAPIIHKTKDRIVFHSINFCPTLEACKILGLETKHVCKRLNENSTDILLKQIDQRLCFSRNYNKLRPNEEFCEEMISISN